MSESFQKLFPEAALSRLIEQDIRVDGRKLFDCRAVQLVRSNVITSCDASAMCTVGKTSVICGIQVQVGPPLPTKPAKGRVEFNIELTGLCSAEPSDHAVIHLEQTLRRLIDDSSLVDLENLCIAKGKCVWVLKCSLLCLDDDGNLTDCCVLAALQALREVKLPTDVVLGEDGIARIVSNKQDQAVLADPSAMEESVLEGTFTVMLDRRTGNCVAIVKTGGPSIDMETITKCLGACKSRKL